jgi:hypothetical protein
MAGLLCPMIASTTESGAFACRQRDTNECRRLWKPTSTTARLPVCTFFSLVTRLGARTYPVSSL